MTYKRNVWALADLHLSWSTPNKDMAIFGPDWTDYMQRIEKAWKEKVAAHDIVLIPGDISWAMKLDQALVDLKWIDELPGTKLMIRGNHDYWWSSLNKLEALGLKSCYFIHNQAFTIGPLSVAGARLWDSSEYGFTEIINYSDDYVPQAVSEEERAKSEAQFEKELGRLKLSLSALSSEASYKVAMTHYPPIGLDLAPSRASKLLEEGGVDYCLFGHLHNLKKGQKFFGKKGGIDYVLVSGDYLGFEPLLILEFEETELSHVRCQKPS